MGFSVYIHVPYCLHRCPYCDFNTYAVSEVPEADYCRALLREIDVAAARPAWAGRSVGTVFFGGGTPSLFSPTSIGKLLAALDKRFGIEEGAEVSLEANPGSLEGSAPERLRALRAAGVSRLSVGVQSFSRRHLAMLGRIHDERDARATLAAARKAGFDNLACDLIFAVPGQRLEEWIADLDQLIECAPEHVSAYGLTYERGTPFARRRETGNLKAADEELELEMYEAAIERLSAAGYRHYEISNFARPGHQCRHNLTYWSWQDYLGLGAGAHGFHRQGPCRRDQTNMPITACAKTSNACGVRYANLRDPEAYMSAARGRTVEYAEALDRETAISEFVLLGLRLIDGLPLARFEETFGCGFDAESPSYRLLINRGFLARNNGSIRLTKRGLLLADSVITRLAAG